MFSGVLAAGPALAQTGGLPPGTSDVFIQTTPSGGTVTTTVPEGTPEPSTPVDTGLAGNPVAGLLVFTETNSQGQAIISDVVGTLAPNATVGTPGHLAFMSDVDEVNGIPAATIASFFVTSAGPTTSIPEPNAPFDVTPYLATTGIKATFQSDTTPVLPPGLSDVFTMSDSTGTVVLSKSAAEAGVGTGGEPALVDIGIPGKTTVGPVVFTESNSAGQTVISDIFGTLAPNATVGTPGNLAFMSDVDEFAGVPPTATSNFVGTPTFMAEPAGPFDVSAYLGATVPAGFTATFQSDTTVPEPSTLALAGAGAAALAGFKLRQRRRIA
jgi:hypothetical protein